MKMFSLFSLAFAAQSAVAIATVFARDVAQVEKGLSAAHTNLTALAHDLHVYVEGGQQVVQQPVLHTDTLNSISVLDTAIANIKSTGAFSPTDASTLLQTATSMEATMNDICQTALTQVTSVGSPANQVKSDVASLAVVFDSMLGALGLAVPPPTSSQVASLKSEIDSACAVMTGPNDPTFL